MVSLSSIFSWYEGVDLVQDFLVTRGYELHERDSHVHKLLVALDGFFPIP